MAHRTTCGAVVSTPYQSDAAAGTQEPPGKGVTLPLSEEHAMMRRLEREWKRRELWPEKAWPWGLRVPDHHSHVQEVLRRACSGCAMSADNQEAHSCITDPAFVQQTLQQDLTHWAWEAGEAAFTPSLEAPEPLAKGAGAAEETVPCYYTTQAASVPPDAAGLRLVVPVALLHELPRPWQHPGLRRRLPQHAAAWAGALEGAPSCLLLAIAPPTEARRAVLSARGLARKRGCLQRVVPRKYASPPPPESPAPSQDEQAKKRRRVMEGGCAGPTTATAGGVQGDDKTAKQTIASENSKALDDKSHASIASVPTGGLVQQQQRQQDAMLANLSNTPAMEETNEVPLNPAEGKPRRRRARGKRNRGRAKTRRAEKNGRRGRKRGRAEKGG